MRACGGCEGRGSHWRWCPEVVGFSAHITGLQSEKAGSLADSVGSNCAGAANHLYVAASLLKTRACELAEIYSGRST